ncbi:MAG: hypothetical protein ACYC23_10860 [Limisphaerales bacterium]
MTSHEYQFRVRDVLRLTFPPLVVMGLFGLLLRALLWAGCLPPPWPALDMDRVILAHQAEASRTAPAAGLILLGDSSCLMNVDPVLLGERLGVEVLNLGTLSYLDLESSGRLFEEFTRHHPVAPHAAVLLLHPESLRVRDPSSYHTESLRRLLAGEDHTDNRSWRGHLSRWLGLETLRGRVLSRLIPAPLSGAYGARYGFTHDLWRFLEANRGGAVDPHSFSHREAVGNAEYRLAPALEVESRSFRRQIPKPTGLFVGITPAPLSFVAPDHAERCRRMTVEWARWLSADLALTNLPTSWDDSLFASVTHLNAPGRRRYTELLAKQLRSESEAWVRGARAQGDVPAHPATPARQQP